jgi:hypothetical protein
MPTGKRELYCSPNGDRWFLARDFATGNVFIRHEANIPSGGRVTEIDIGTFLDGGERHPEHQALLRLLGTLLGTSPRADHTRRKRRGRRGGLLEKHRENPS